MSNYASGISHIEYIEHMIKNAQEGISMKECASYYGCKHCEHQLILKNARQADERYRDNYR